MKQPHQIMKRRIAMGIWVDMNDAVHISVPELLQHFEMTDTPENRRVVTEVAKKAIREITSECKMDAVIIERAQDV
jgi:hypothetical protein